MTINYIPNDPLAGWPIPITRRQSPRPDPASNLAGYWYNGIVPEALYAVGSSEFLFWQCSESALAALELWSELDGGLRRWAVGRQRLDLRQNAGEDLNAYYDRKSLSFFERTTGNKTTYSGASQDVVAHEAGHGLLDAIRPDIWASNFLEVNAFHEAFGDCIAILTALRDRRTRHDLLQRTPDLWKEDFVDATAEDLSDGIRRISPNHNASVPRRAFNWHEWDFPANLPYDGGPGKLLNESHSFGMIFSGCFWDTIGNIFNLAGVQSQQALWKAAKTAGKLLIAGTRAATETPRFFRAVGEAMLQADQDQFGGANQVAIRSAFEFHKVNLGMPGVVPVAALSGVAPRVAVRKASISAATRRDLMRRLGADRGSKMSVRARTIAGQSYAEAVHERTIDLSGVHRSLRGVVAIAAEPVLVGATFSRAAVMGALPQADVSHDEVCAFVCSLVANHCIEHGRTTGRKKAGRRRGAAGNTGLTSLPTHKIKKIGSKRVLTRVRFACSVPCIHGIDNSPRRSAFGADGVVHRRRS